MNLKKKNVLVAGGTGLVGANLTRRLAELGACVKSTYLTRRPLGLGAEWKKADFTDMDDCLEATKGMDIVCIAAAFTLGAKVVAEQPTAFVLPNLKINCGLFEACRINRVERTVFISSSTVYQVADYPIAEDQLDLNQPPFELYLGSAWMKRYCETVADFYKERYKMKIGIARPANLYGPYDKFDQERAHVLPALITRALGKETPFVVWGDGLAVRDFIYVEDFVDCLIDIMQKACDGDPINVATGQSITTGEAARVILEICGHHVQPQFDATKPNAIPYRMLDISKLERVLGRRQWTPFKKGISQTVQWAKSQEQRLVEANR